LQGVRGFARGTGAPFSFLRRPRGPSPEEGKVDRLGQGQRRTGHWLRSKTSCKQLASARRVPFHHQKRRRANRGGLRRKKGGLISEQTFVALKKQLVFQDARKEEAEQPLTLGLEQMKKKEGNRRKRENHDEQDGKRANAFYSSSDY